MKLPVRRNPPTKIHSTTQLQGEYPAVSIEGLTHDGRGVAKIMGKTVFVTNAVPGDIVDIKIRNDKSTLAEAKVTKWQQRSADRSSPFCDYYGRCGGCSLQHLNLEAQRHWKQQNFLDQLRKALDCRKLIIEPAYGIKDQIAYRRRARMVLTKDAKTKQPLLGFRQTNSNWVVDIEQCPVLTPALNQALQNARFDLLPLASRQNREVDLVEADQGVYLNAGIYQNLASDETPSYQLNGMTFQFDPLGFIQVNASVNSALVEQAINWLELCSSDRVLDLFCGIGNFSLPLATVSAEVIGVEGDEKAVALAKKNAKLNQLTNLSFYQSDLFQDNQHQAWWSTNYEAILLDPGRLGAKRLAENIGELQANKILYISCQSDTLTRDLIAIEKQGYRVKRAQIFDMFPHTSHFESMVLLEKR